MLRHLIPLLIVLALGACAPKREIGGAEGLAEPMTEPMVLEEAPADLACLPGDDDGIGGTGCPVN